MRLRKGSRIRPPGDRTADRAPLAAVPEPAWHGRGFDHGGVASRVPSRSCGTAHVGRRDLFAYLCMHGALHWWNRLKWLADVNALLASTSEDGVEHLIRAAAGARGAPPLRPCCFAGGSWGRPLPARLMATLGKSATVRWLEATALNAMTTGQGEHYPHDVRFGTTRGSLSTLFLSRSWRYRLAELNNHLTNQTNALTLLLPGRLRFSLFDPAGPTLGLPSRQKTRRKLIPGPSLHLACQQVRTRGRSGMRRFPAALRSTAITDTASNYDRADHQYRQGCQNRPFDRGPCSCVGCMDFFRLAGLRDLRHCRAASYECCINLCATLCAVYACRHRRRRRSRCARFSERERTYRRRPNRRGE